MIFSVVLCNLFQSVGLLACHESWRRIFVYTSSQNTKSELRVFLKRVVSLKFTLRSRINGGGGGGGGSIKQGLGNLCKI